MNSERPENLKKTNIANTENCSVCRDLLANLERFYSILEATRNCPISEWLTVDEIAKELKVSKSIIYRLIRHGELEAVDIVDCNSRIRQKGHYRINRSSLKNYLEAKRVKPLPKESLCISQHRNFPKVKNHLGL